MPCYVAWTIPETRDARVSSRRGRGPGQVGVDQARRRLLLRVEWLREVTCTTLPAIKVGVLTLYDLLTPRRVIGLRIALT